MCFETFEGSARSSLGVELELQLLDIHSLALTGARDRVLAGIPPEFQDSVKPEFYDSCIEINTGVCHDVDAVERDLLPKLAAVAQAAARHGVLLGWGGTHPFSHWRDQPIVPTPRYRELAEQYRETLCRQVIFGLHVHVGVADGDAAARVCNGIAEHLPALLALSVNSPFWSGRATGLHSHRVEVMASTPGGGLPPRLGGWDDYVRLVRRLASSGIIGTAKDLWWDVRPSPGNGTVEVRLCDMPPDLPSVLGLAALIQCLVADLAHAGGRPIEDDCGIMIVRQNRWRASRHGLGAGFVDHRSGRTSSARDGIKALVDRLGGVAATLGCTRHLEHARAMADSESGAERQLATFERTGDLREVVRRQMIPPTVGPGPLVAPPGHPAVPGGVLMATPGSWSRPPGLLRTSGAVTAG